MDDGCQELFVTPNYRPYHPDLRGTRNLSIKPGNRNGSTMGVLPKARFNTRELDALPLTVNTMAADGRHTVVHGSAICGTRR